MDPFLWVSSPREDILQPFLSFFSLSLRPLDKSFHLLASSSLSLGYKENGTPSLSINSREREKEAAAGLERRAIYALFFLSFLEENNACQKDEKTLGPKRKRVPVLFSMKMRINYANDFGKKKRKSFSKVQIRLPTS